MFTRDWNLGDLRRAVARLRAGDTLEQVAADLDRTPNALKLAIPRLTGERMGPLLHEGREARRAPARAAFLAGTMTAAEAGATDGLTERGWYRYMQREHPDYDRYRLTRISEAQARRATVERLNGASYAEAAVRAGFARATAYKVIRRYADRVGLVAPRLPGRAS